MDREELTEKILRLIDQDMKEKGVSSYDLQRGEKRNYSFTYNTLRNIRKTGKASISTLENMAKDLGYSVDYLLKKDK